MNAPHKVIYESNDVTILADLRPSAGVVVGYSHIPENSSFSAFGDGIVQKLGFSGVFVVAKSNHWWQMPDRDKAIGSVKALVSSYREVIAYGSSMGGYGALTLAYPMGCNRIVAISPQTIISDPKMPMNPTWAEAIARRPILRDNIFEDIGTIVPEILYDPDSFDDLSHVRYLSSKRQLVRRTFPFAGHKILATLKECGILRETTSAILKLLPNARDLRRLYQANRHRSARYLFNVARFHIRRGNMEAAAKIPAMIEAAGDHASALRLHNLIVRTTERLRL